MTETASMTSPMARSKAGKGQTSCGVHTAGSPLIVKD